MPGPLHHAPARVLLQLLVDLGLGTDPDADRSIAEASLVYPMYWDREPDKPDTLIKISDTEGRSFGNTQLEGERQEHEGIQFFIRGNDKEAIYRHMKEIAVALSTLSQRIVTIEDESGTGTLGTSYSVGSFTQTTGIIPIPTDTPQGKRVIYVLNGTCPIRRCA